MQVCSRHAHQFIQHLRSHPAGPGYTQPDRGHTWCCTPASRLHPTRLPFSMAFVALLMRPWISYIRAHQVEVMVLADDFPVRIEAPSCLPCIQGMGLPRQFFADIGANIAHTQCFMASTCPTTRAPHLGPPMGRPRHDHQHGDTTFGISGTRQP